MKQLAIVLILIIIISCYGKRPKRNNTGLEGQPMPAIELLSVDSVTRFHTNSISLGKPTVLFGFMPSCPYCRAQTKAIISKINSLKDINIYMLSYSSYSDFKKFYDNYGLKKYPNIKAGIDYKLTFARYFKTTAVPIFAVYKPDKTLKEILMGKNYISKIKETAFN